jgi:glycosyltransferase involved in cell wall biosynthesis
VRVTVVVTTFQHERYIAQALDSVLEQTGEVSFELLVGDDGSTDGTRDVVAECARAHADLVRAFLPEHNLGPGGKAIFA